MDIRSFLSESRVDEAHRGASDLTFGAEWAAYFELVNEGNDADLEKVGNTVAVQIKKDGRTSGTAFGVGASKVQVTFKVGDQSATIQIFRSRSGYEAAMKVQGSKDSRFTDLGTLVELGKKAGGNQKIGRAIVDRVEGGLKHESVELGEAMNWSAEELKVASPFSREVARAIEAGGSKADITTPQRHILSVHVGQERTGWNRFEIDISNVLSGGDKLAAQVSSKNRKVSRTITSSDPKKLGKAIGDFIVKASARRAHEGVEPPTDTLFEEATHALASWGKTPDEKERYLAERLEQRVQVRVSNTAFGDFRGGSSGGYPLPGEYGVHVSGGSFPIKDELKKLGLKFDQRNKGWSMIHIRDDHRSHRGNVPEAKVRATIEKVNDLVQRHNDGILRKNQDHFATVGYPSDEMKTPLPSTTKKKIKEVESGIRRKARLDRYDVKVRILWKGNRTIHDADIVFEGNTYPIKELLKRVGFRFNNGAWSLPYLEYMSIQNKFESDIAKTLKKSHGDRPALRQPNASPEPASARIKRQKSAAWKASQRGYMEHSNLSDFLAAGRLDEAQRGAPGLAFGGEDKPTKPGGFKVSSKVLKMWKDEAGKGPEEMLFPKVRAAITAIPRDKLGLAWGVKDDPHLNDTQDFIAGKPRPAFNKWMQNLQKVSPKLAKYVRKVPSNAGLLYLIFVTRVSGEMMALQIFKRYFETDSDDPRAKRAKYAESEGSDLGEAESYSGYAVSGGGVGRKYKSSLDGKMRGGSMSYRYGSYGINPAAKRVAGNLPAGYEKQGWVVGNGKLQGLSGTFKTPVAAAKAIEKHDLATLAKFSEDVDQSTDPFFEEAGGNPTPPAVGKKLMKGLGAITPKAKLRILDTDKFGPSKRSQWGMSATIGIVTAKNEKLQAQFVIRQPDDNYFQGTVNLPRDWGGQIVSVGSKTGLDALCKMMLDRVVKHLSRGAKTESFEDLDRLSLSEKRSIADAVKDPNRVSRFLGVNNGDDIPVDRIDATIREMKGRTGRSKDETGMLRALMLAKRLKSAGSSSVEASAFGRVGLLVESVGPTNLNQLVIESSRQRPEERDVPSKDALMEMVGGSMHLAKTVMERSRDDAHRRTQGPEPLEEGPRWDGKIVGKAYRLQWSGYHFVLEELPVKGKKKLRKLTLQNPGFSNRHAAFIAQNILRVAKIAGGDVYDKVKSKLSSAMEAAVKEAGLDKKTWFHPREEMVFYLQVEPEDVDPLDIDAKDFVVHAEWTKFSAYSPGSDMRGGHDPSYTKLVSKSPGAARKLFKMLKANESILKGISFDKFTEWLKKKKIGYEYQHSVWS